MRGVDDEDEEGLQVALAKHYGKALARNTLGLVPVLGPAAAQAIERGGDRIASTPGTTALAAGWEGLMAAIELSDDEREFSSYDARNFTTLMTLLTGLPLTPVGRTGGYLLDVEQGRAEPEGALDVARGLVTGAR
jgi:hypothetical protein